MLLSLVLALVVGASSAAAALSCDAGYYCPQVVCPVGAYCPAGVNAPVTCPAGAYCNATGLSAPVACPVGTTNAAEGATSPGACVVCPKGGYCPSAASGWVACPAGTYSSTAGATAAGTCKTCPSGAWCGVGSAAATYCVGGQYSPLPGATDASACAPCPVGGYCPYTNSFVPCPAGTYNSLTGRTRVTHCTACAAGTFSGATGANSSSTCQTCPAGTWCGAGAGAPTSCSAGQYSPQPGAASNSTCSPCGAGGYCPSAATFTPCSAGTWSSATGQTAAATCAACPVSTYNPDTGSTAASACIACPDGTASNVTGATSDAVCVSVCASGSFNPTPGAPNAVCQSCSAGFWCPGTSAAVPCAAGTYNPATGATAASACLTCPIGYVCPANTTAGSAAPTLCPPPYICDAPGMGAGRSGPLDLTAPASFGTYYTPFAVDSPWNSRPLNPTLATWQIPATSQGWNAAIDWQSYSVGLFYASELDPPMNVYPSGTTINDADTDQSRVITVPHWPPNVVPAPGNPNQPCDCHADVYDATTGIIHSFWPLRYDNATSRWISSLYAFTYADGRGWGDGAHYYAGVRAVGVVPSGGLIRHHEKGDGLPYYRHALCASLDYSGLTNTFVFPATRRDGDGRTNQNYGQIPEGALVMLPASFDASAFNPAIRKIAETLKRYGAYITDRNVGTPIAFYAEQGGPSLYALSGWTNAVTTQLNSIWKALRMVTNTQLDSAQWVDGLDRPMAAPKPNNSTNLLSLKGFKLYSGPNVGSYNSWKQRLEFQPATAATVIYNGETNGMNRFPGSWANIVVNGTYALSVTATSGAAFRMQLWTGGTVWRDTGYLGNGVTRLVTWPTGGWTTLYASSGAANTFSTVAVTFTRVYPSP